MSASWILIPGLVSLRNEFNELSPQRDKASDGSIGDTAHANESSDHNPDETGTTPYEDSDRINEVHAIDVDDDLRLPGWDMTKATRIIAERHRTGKDNRLQNIIYERKIISRSWDWDGWRTYTGSSPHDEHAHFSARYTTAQEADTRPWGLLETWEEENMPTIDEIRAAVRTEITAQLDDIAKAVNNTYRIAGTENGDSYKRNSDQVNVDLWQALIASGQIGGGNALPSAGALGQLLNANAAIVAEMAAVRGALSALVAKLNAVPKA